jgi:hypothetical protein
MDLAAGVDAGFSPGWFAQALANVDRFPDEEFAVYGIGVDRIERVREIMRGWSRELASELHQPKPEVTIRPAASNDQRMEGKGNLTEPGREPWSGREPPS